VVERRVSSEYQCLADTTCRFAGMLVLFCMLLLLVVEVPVTLIVTGPLTLSVAPPLTYIADCVVSGDGN
jgi:hypothetical protein